MTTTYNLTPPARHAAELLQRPLHDGVAAALRLLRDFGRYLQMPAPTVPEARAELLRLASTYESTQPSYAADLRAAAQRSA